MLCAIGHRCHPPSALFVPLSVRAGLGGGVDIKEILKPYVGGLGGKGDALKLNRGVRDKAEGGGEGEGEGTDNKTKSGGWEEGRHIKVIEAKYRGEGETTHIY